MCVIDSQPENILEVTRPGGRMESVQIWGPEVGSKYHSWPLASGGHRIQTCSGCLAKPVWSRASPPRRKWMGTLFGGSSSHAVQTRACCTWVNTRPKSEPTLI